MLLTATVAVLFLAGCDGMGMNTGRSAETGPTENLDGMDGEQIDSLATN